MKITEIMFSGLAAKQYAHFFNQNNGINLNLSTIIKEGICFVTIDFGNTSIELIAQFMYRMGEIQEGLRNDRELMLPIEKYPLPPGNNG
jgi:hypothetical protein